MKLSDLIRKANRGTLEVEHLLEAAAARLPNLQAELQQLAAQHNWQTAEESELTREVPLATWAAVAGAYAEGGLSSLHPFRDQYASFCVGVLEMLRSEVAVEALLTWWPEATSSVDQASQQVWRIAAALNLILCFKGAPEIAESNRSSVRQLAYRSYLVAETQAQRATALLLLRGVGDEESLAFVSRADDFDGPWADTKPIVLRAIRRRLDSANKRVQATRSKQRAPDA